MSYSATEAVETGVTPKVVSRRVRGGSNGGVRPTKLQATCDRLTEMAREIGPGAKFPTILQLRDRFGVSVVTLSAALDELEAQRLIQRKHGVGIYVSSRIRQRNIALVCDPSFFRALGASPFWNLLVERLRERAEQHGESIWLHFTAGAWEAPDAENGRALLNDGLADELATGRIDGVLGIGLGSAVSWWIEKQGVPLVAFAGPAKSYVGMDASAIVRLGVEALAQQGCRRIAFWSPVSPYRAAAGNGTPPPGDTRRAAAFRQAVIDHGLIYEESLVRDNRHLMAPGSYHTLSHQEQGFQAAMEIFGDSTDIAARPDGIVSGDDMLTVGILAALHKQGLRAGRDIKIATHANVGSPALAGWEDDLILIEVDPAEIVSRMFTLLEMHMNRGEADAASGSHTAEGVKEEWVLPRIRH